MKRFAFVNLSIFLLLNIIYSQDVIGKLGGNTSNETFDLYDSNDNLLFRIQGDGKVGIGTSLPVSPLHIVGQTSILGKVGINTYSPLQTLHVEGDARFNDFIGIDNTTTFSQIHLDFFDDDFDLDHHGGGILFQTSNNNNISGTTRMRIKKTGQIGIGTYFPTHTLHIEADSSSNCVLKVVNKSNNALADGIRIKIGPNTNPGVNNDYIEMKDGNGTIVGYICGDGAGGVNFTSVSDRILKMNISDYKNALNIVSKIRVREYEMKSAPGNKRVGLIAQELLEVIPQVVSISNYENKLMGIDYGKLTPLLVKAIQELQARVVELENMLDG